MLTANVKTRDVHFVESPEKNSAEKFCGGIPDVEQEMFTLYYV